MQTFKIVFINIPIINHNNLQLKIQQQRQNIQMKLTKGQLKTWNSQQSDIDMFSKLESTFLEKFFRLNLIDYFQEYVANMYEIHPSKNTLSKNQRTFLNYLFRVEDSFFINQFEQKIHSFYKYRARSFENGELQHIFKTRYCNWNPVPNLFSKGELILIDVKIKAQIERLETIPLKLIETFESACKGQNSNRNSKSQDDEFLKKTLKHYSNEFVNIFIIYFGDINFHLVSKKNYEQQSIKLYGKKFKLRIFTFYISKQALLESFRSMNKINTLENINDLAIQFYELRRQKKRLKKNSKKENSQKPQKDQSKQIKKLPLKIIDLKLEEISKYLKFIIGGVGIVGLLYFLKKKMT